MAKPLKIAALVVGVLIAVIVIIAIALILLVDPNRYRDDIVRLVKTETGRDLKIDGKLRLSLLPWIGLETKRLELANAAGFGPAPFAVVDSTETKVELLPLLRQKIVVSAVRLNGLKLNLARRADGRSNWDDLSAAKPTRESKPTPAAGNGAGAALAAFTIERFDLRGGELTWRDQSANTTYALRNIDLRASNVLGAQAAPLHLAFDLDSSQPKLQLRLNLDTRLRLDPKTQTLEIPELSFSAGDLRVQAKLRGEKILSAPTMSGTLDIAGFDPRATLQQFGIKYAPADTKALRKLALAGKFEVSSKAITLSDLRLALDDTQLTGSIALRPAPAASYRFDLALDRIDLDRYLPAASTDKQPARASNNAAAVAIPIALLRETDADGALRIGSLKAFGIRSADVHIKVAARDGRVTLGPNSAKLYGGSYAGRTAFDAATPNLNWEFAEKLTNVQLGPLLKDAGVFDRYTGTGNIDLNLTAKGGEADQITRTLNGTVALQFRDGKIEGVNLEKMVQDARALIAQARGREVEAQAKSGDETAFKSLSATARVTNGVARNDDLKLEGAVVRAQGSGNANLVEQTLDFRLQVTVAEGATHKGSTVPLRIDGPFAKPRYRVDTSALLKEQTKPAQEKLEKKIDEKLDRLRNKLRR